MFNGGKQNLDMVYCAYAIPALCLKVRALLLTTITQQPSHLSLSTTNSVLPMFHLDLKNLEFVPRVQRWMGGREEDEQS